VLKNNKERYRCIIIKHNRYFMGYAA